MHVNTPGLRSGANNSYSAADHAHEGAGALSRVGVDSTIFGDFDEAKSFHQTVTSAHSRHVGLIKAHTEELGTIGDKAHKAAGQFDDMEEHNRNQLTL